MATNLVVESGAFPALVYQVSDELLPVFSISFSCVEVSERSLFVRLVFILGLDRSLS